MACASTSCTKWRAMPPSCVAEDVSVEQMEALAEGPARGRRHEVLLFLKSETSPGSSTALQPQPHLGRRHHRCHPQPMLKPPFRGGRHGRRWSCQPADGDNVGLPMASAFWICTTSSRFLLAVVYLASSSRDTHTDTWNRLTLP